MASPARHDHQETGQNDQRCNAADRPRPSQKHGRERAGESRRQRKKVDELARERIDLAAHDHRRGLLSGPRPAGHQSHQHDETRVRREDHSDLPQPCHQIADHGFGRAQAKQNRPQAFARIRDPDQMRTHHDACDNGRDERIVRVEGRPRALVQKRKQHEQSDQDQPDIGREQQQPDLDREQQPVGPAALADRAPIVQQDDRPQRHGEDDGPEVRCRHRKGGHPDHQQHRQRRVLRAHDRAPEREYGPIGRDHADLRQHIDAEHAGNSEHDLGEPERERRSKVGAELELVSDREHVRHVTGRTGIEQGGNQRPQQRLHQRRQPDGQRRARAQQFNENGDVKHQPDVGSTRPAQIRPWR